VLRFLPHHACHPSGADRGHRLIPAARRPAPDQPQMPRWAAELRRSRPLSTLGTLASPVFKPKLDQEGRASTPFRPPPTGRNRCVQANPGLGTGNPLLGSSNSHAAWSHPPCSSRGGGVPGVSLRQRNAVARVRTRDARGPAWEPSAGRPGPNPIIASTGEGVPCTPTGHFGAWAGLPVALHDDLAAPAEGGTAWVRSRLGRAKITAR
jgi:hypothetical protein